MLSPICSELLVTDNTPHGQVGQSAFFRLTLERPAWESWLPGQFVMLKSRNWGNGMTWARPISIFRMADTGLMLFIQVIGRGTQRLNDLKPGDPVTIWGPLGTSFAQTVDSPTLLLAGGMGIAPFIGYTETHPAPDRLSMLFGHRLPLANYPTDFLTHRISFKSVQEKNERDLRAFQAEVRAALEQCKTQNGLALACGPFPFLYFVWAQALRLGVRTQLSLEQKMACGIGACLGCVTVSSQNWPEKVIAGLPVQTCTKGPVFWADQIDLDAKPDPGV